MFCTQCGVELKSDDCFCCRCGHATGLCRPPEPARKLKLDKRNKKIAGVCAGFARYFEMDLNLVRILWLAIAICTGVGFIAYLLAWMILPSDHGQEPSVEVVPQAAPQTPHTV